MTDIIKLISLILAVSIASDRLVTLIKTILPFLAAAPATGQPEKSIPGIIKKVLLMAIAFGCGWLTASFLPQPITIGKIDIPVPVMGLLASGGSAFWTNVLGYVSGLKDLANQKAVQAKQAIAANQQ
jgi:hypothetical protein